MYGRLGLGLSVRCFSDCGGRHLRGVLFRELPTPLLSVTELADSVESALHDISPWVMVEASRYLSLWLPHSTI